MNKSRSSSKKQVGKCVLYVTSDSESVVGGRALVEAQKRALELRVPMAVVYCQTAKINKKEKAKLLALETILNTLSIPLMVLLGMPPNTLSAVVHHTNPQVIYFDQDPSLKPLLLTKSFFTSGLFSSRVINGTSMSQLDTHLYAWPGVIISVDRLFLEMST